LNIGSVGGGELSSVRRSRFGTCFATGKVCAGEELDGKVAVKNLFTKPSHLHYTRPFALELIYSLIFAQEGQTSVCR
jgi:hypothetical protein